MSAAKIDPKMLHDSEPYFILPINGIGWRKGYWNEIQTSFDAGKDWYTLDQLEDVRIYPDPAALPAVGGAVVKDCLTSESALAEPTPGREAKITYRQFCERFGTGSLSGACDIIDARDARIAELEGEVKSLAERERFLEQAVRDAWHGGHDYAVEQREEATSATSEVRQAMIRIRRASDENVLAVYPVVEHAHKRLNEDRAWENYSRDCELVAEYFSAPTPATDEPLTFEAAKGMGPNRTAKTYAFWGNDMLGLYVDFGGGVTLKSRDRTEIGLPIKTISQFAGQLKALGFSALRTDAKGGANGKA